VSQLGVAAGAELVGDLDDREQAMLEFFALLGGGGPAERLEPTVDLNRVAVDRDRILSALAQELRDGDGEAGLADGRRPEQRQQLQAARLSRRS
jgi:hypothetical protein